MLLNDKWKVDNDKIRQHKTVLLYFIFSLSQAIVIYHYGNNNISDNLTNILYQSIFYKNNKGIYKVELYT